MSEEVQEQTSEVGLKEGDLLAGRFEIQKMLAEGGMGRVYVAIQQPMGRKVAVKVMKRELVSDQASVKRFFREAVAVSKLSHPNTITIIDYGEGEGKNLYIAMEYLEGEPLSDILIREGAMPLARTVSIIGQIARSLTEAHRKGVIHRDLKPENVFISNVEAGSDLVKVLDFGIAKLQQHEGTKITRLGYVCGTPEYMSPEQARGEDLDGRTDVYALGVVMWEMLEGRVPFHAPTPLGIVLKHQSDPIPPLTVDVPESVKAFVYRVMSKDPVERPAGAEAFLDEMLAACPADLETYSVATATGQRLSMAPHTPQPMNETGDIAIASTLADGSFATSDVPAVTKSPLPKILAIGGVLLVLLGLGGVGAMVLANSDADPPAGEDDVVLSPVKNEARTPTLKIDGLPAEAEVFENGEMIGLAPTNIEGVGGEKRTFEIRKEGYETATLEQKLPESGPLKVVYNLNKVAAAEKVRITVETEPPGAAIVRGEDTVAQTPYVFELEPGEDAFDVELKLDKYAPQTVKLDPAAGSQTFKLPLTAAKKARGKRAGTAKAPAAGNGAKQETAKKKEKAPKEKPKEAKTEPAKKPKKKYELMH